MKKWIAGIYGHIKVKKGQCHEYLEMDLDYSTLGQVQVSMGPYIKKIIDEFLEKIEMSTASISAAGHYSLLEIQRMQNVVSQSSSTILLCCGTTIIHK